VRRLPAVDVVAQHQDDFEVDLLLELGKAIAGLVLGTPTGSGIADYGEAKRIGQIGKLLRPDRTTQADGNHHGGRALHGCIIADPRRVQIQSFVSMSWYACPGMHVPVCMSRLFRTEFPIMLVSITMSFRN